MSPPLNPVDRLEVIEAMRRYGGGFVSSLAEAWVRADPDNEARLRAAFPELWAWYGEMARDGAARARAVVDDAKARACAEAFAPLAHAARALVARIDASGNTAEYSVEESDRLDEVRGQLDEADRTGQGEEAPEEV